MLSTTTQYALRALSHLARQSGDAVLGRDLAESVEIPANYLSKVLVTLRNAGLVVTTRGSGGGYRLSKPAHEIHLIDVVELFEEFLICTPLSAIAGNPGDLWKSSAAAGAERFMGLGHARGI
jgi:Rrf2 family protein